MVFIGGDDDVHHLFAKDFMTDLTVLKAALGALEEAARAARRQFSGNDTHRLDACRVGLNEALPALHDLIGRMEAKPIGGLQSHLPKHIAEEYQNRETADPNDYQAPAMREAKTAFDYARGASEARVSIMTETATKMAMREPGMASEAWQKYAKDKNIDLTVREMVISGHTEYEQVYTDGCYEAYLSGFWEGQKAMQPTPRGEVRLPTICGFCKGLDGRHYQDCAVTASAKPNGE